MNDRKRTSIHLAIAMITIIVVAQTANCEIMSIQVPLKDISYQSNGEGTWIQISDFGYLNVPGAPRLPSRILAIAIPPMAKFEKLDILSLHNSTQTGITVPPVQPPRLIREQDKNKAMQDMDIYNQNRDRIYSNDSFYPATLGTFKKTAFWRQYNLVEVHLTPVQWNPVTSEMITHDNLEIQIEYSFEQNSACEIPEASSSRPLDPAFQRFIYNYDQAGPWYTSSNQSSRGLYDFVIITSNALTSSVQPIVDWETQKGRTVQVVTVESIAAQYSGADLAQKMRNFLREKYPDTVWGIRDALFVGSLSQVPMRMVDANAGYGKPDTDFYFAELSLPDNESWDSNNNGRYLDSGDNVEFFAEINVGRIPWGDAATVTHICEKSAAFELNSDETFKKNILLLGAYFWDDTDNAVLMEAKTDQPWMTDWTKTRLYEQNSDYYSTYECDMPLNRTNTLSVWSQGRFAFVNWAGHGSEVSAHILGSGSPAFITSSDCPSLNDDYPSIIFADACSNSDTSTTNIGMAMLKKGAVGFVGATKVAYGTNAWSSPLDGSSQSLDYYFTTAVTSGEYSQGAAHQYGLLSVYQNDGWYEPDYEISEWNLWGNPDLGFGNLKNGNVVFDQNFYRPLSEATITVRDADLNLNPEQPESVEVTLNSTSGDEETLILQETGFSTSLFTGSIMIVETGSMVQDGQISAQNGDTLTVLYIDADDGYGGTNVQKTDTAMIDAQSPAISGFEITDITSNSFSLRWETDEPATSTVRYGAGSLEKEKTDTALSESHFITVTELDECKNYIFIIGSMDEAGNSIWDDNNGMYYIVTTYEVSTILEENMDQDPGWVTTNQWEWGVPQGQGGEHGYPDPTSGHTGANVYGFNLVGDYPNNMPEYTLTSISFDCSEAEGTILSFYRWLGVETNEYDHARIKISKDGTTWTNIWQNPSSETADNQWTYQEFDISEIADGQSNVMIRWTMGTTDGGWMYCGWNIDDVKIWSTKPCTNPDPTPTPRPTVTPTPDVTEPTPTPTPEPVPGMKLFMDDTDLVAGDSFHLYFSLTNPFSQSMTADLYVVLEAFGNFYFWPSWSNLNDGADCMSTVVIPAGTDLKYDVLEFIWPEDVGSAMNLWFYGACFDSSSYEIIGNLDSISFRYH